MSRLQRLCSYKPCSNSARLGASFGQFVAVYSRCAGGADRPGFQSSSAGTRPLAALGQHDDLVGVACSGELAVGSSGAAVVGAED